MSEIVAQLRVSLLIDGLLIDYSDLDVNLTNPMTGKTAVVYAAESEYADCTFLLVLHPHAAATGTILID